MEQKSSLSENWGAPCSRSCLPPSDFNAGWRYIVYKQPLSLDRFFLHEINSQEATAAKLDNGFVIISLNRFQQIIGVHTFQASSEQVKVFGILPSSQSIPSPILTRPRDCVSPYKWAGSKSSNKSGGSVQLRVANWRIRLCLTIIQTTVVIDLFDVSTVWALIGRLQGSHTVCTHKTDLQTAFQCGGVPLNFIP